MAVINYNVTYYEKINDALDLIEPNKQFLIETIRDKIGTDEFFEISPDIKLEKLKFKTDGKADVSKGNSEVRARNSFKNLIFKNCLKKGMVESARCYIFLHFVICPDCIWCYKVLSKIYGSG